VKDFIGMTSKQIMKAVVKEKVSKGHIVPIQSYGGKGPSIFD
jgi:hypothetical protein